MDEEDQTLVDQNFRLFKSRKTVSKKAPSPSPTTTTEIPSHSLTKQTNPESIAPNFSSLGLAEWAVQTCKELSMDRPTPVQEHCIPRILAGEDVLGIAETGSGKTAAFVLPILQRFAGNPYGVFALVVTPTRELADQLAEQFRALGSCLNLRCAVVIGGMDMITQARTLLQRPHIVIATPGRIRYLLEANPDVPPIFSKTKPPARWRWETISAT